MSDEEAWSEELFPGIFVVGHADDTGGNQGIIIDKDGKQYTWKKKKMDFVSPWIHTTNRCNLKCHYCYVKGNDVMGIDIYSALEKLLMGLPTNYRHLRFAGGEPTLTFPIWKQFAQDMLNRSGTSVEVLTNLITVPEDFWKFAETENVNVSISLDNGNTMKRLNKSIDKKLKRLRNPWIMTTITEENVNNLDTLAAFIGLNNYGWCITTDYFEKTIPDMETLAEAVVQVLYILKEFDYDFTKISFNNFSIKSNFSGCRAGDEMFAVAPDGNIYTCQTQIGKTPVGNVYDGYTRRIASCRIECGDCSISHLCSGWCPIHHKIPNPICDVIKLFANYVIKEVDHAE